MKLVHHKFLLFIITIIVIIMVKRYCKDLKTIERCNDREMKLSNVIVGGKYNQNLNEKYEPTVTTHNTQIHTNQACYRNAFQNHVIVMNFNYPKYENNEILRDLYKDVFGVILTCGPRQKDPLKKGPDLWYDDGHWFYYRYLCLTLAMEKYPGYSGYFYSNDDLIVNWWNLVNFDTSKVWQGVQGDWRQKAFESVIEKEWMWWKTENGIKACQQYYVKLKKHAQSDLLFNKAYTTYMRNGNDSARCSKGWSDMFYVPGRLRKEYVMLSKLARESNLILEIAVGNIIRSLDYEENIDTLNGLYVPNLRLGLKAKKADVFWTIYNLNMTFIHPVKFNNMDSHLTLSVFRNFVLPYKNLLTRC